MHASPAMHPPPADRRRARPRRRRLDDTQWSSGDAREASENPTSGARARHHWCGDRDGHRTGGADAPARERELTCSDRTTFTGEQVRQRAGSPPHTWRNVSPGSRPAAFTFYASMVTAPDGPVVEDATFDDTQGVARIHELVTCSFIIPIGPLTGYRADFEDFSSPAA